MRSIGHRSMLDVGIRSICVISEMCDHGMGSSYLIQRGSCPVPRDNQSLLIAPMFANSYFCNYGSHIYKQMNRYYSQERSYKQMLKEFNEQKEKETQ